MAARTSRFSFPLVVAAVCAAGPVLAGTPAFFGFTWLHGASAPAAPYAFSNIDVRPVYVSDPPGNAAFVSRALFDLYGVASVLGFNDFLYGEDNTSATPRPDAIERFDAWWSQNSGAIRPPWVIGVWPADEALDRCSTSPDLDACLAPYYAFVGHIHDLVAPGGVVLADSFSASAVSSGLLAQQAERLAAAGVTWFGYHQYYVLHPLGDPAYQANVAAVRAVVGEVASHGADARFVLIGDGFHAPWGHLKSVGGRTVPWTWADHATVVEEDFQVASANDAVALIFFNWPDYSWLSETATEGSVSFRYPAGCREACLGRLVKLGEDTCGLCDARPIRRRVTGPR